MLLLRHRVRQIDVSDRFQIESAGVTAAQAVARGLRTGSRVSLRLFMKTAAKSPRGDSF